MASEGLSKTRCADASDRYIRVRSRPGRRTVSSLKSTVLDQHPDSETSATKGGGLLVVCEFNWLV